MGGWVSWSTVFYSLDTLQQQVKADKKEVSECTFAVTVPKWLRLP